MSGGLHQPRARLGEFGALAAVQRDVGDEGLSFQAVPRVNEAVTAAVHVRIVDLRRIADEHEFRIARHPPKPRPLAQQHIE